MTAISMLQTLAEKCAALDLGRGPQDGWSTGGTAGLGGGSVQPRLL
jgi:hypothetical protein